MVTLRKNFPNKDFIVPYLVVLGPNLGKYLTTFHAVQSATTSYQYIPISEIDF